MNSQNFDPLKCTALVTCINGIVKTQSCQTKQPLRSEPDTSDGSCDSYTCPDCGKFIRVCYEE